MGRESTNDTWRDSGSKLGAKIGANIATTAYRAKRKADKVTHQLNKHMKKGTESARVKQNVRIYNIRYEVQMREMKILYSSCLHCIDLLKAYESLLIDCVEKKLMAGKGICAAIIRFDSIRESDLEGANKIIHLLDRMQANLEFIKNVLRTYKNSPVLLSRNDEEQAKMYGGYITSIKKVIYEDDNVKIFDWTKLKTKDRFRNFRTVDALFEKLAKIKLSAVETCTNAVDCMYANIAHFWNRRLRQINNLTGGALGYIAQQNVPVARHEQIFQEQLRDHIIQLRKKYERQANQQFRRERERLQRENGALLPQPVSREERKRQQQSKGQQQQDQQNQQKQQQHSRRKRSST
ncbi:MAG: hypothetical protein CMM15_10530 [Rhodospirillaceae bacterium]|nr:hypothetical protein [Rhodospirillaceae bacterium]OUX68003.1 MAG: hypothetical protein CBD38_00865 [bacterium TMED178]|tara:strand:- start:2033 stop:3082 length:1050 start_codon:yes stop_codon:yes gene_type:complete